MRDKRARAINRPPFKVVSDQALKEIARAKPRSPRGLKKIRGVSDLMIRRFGDQILAAVRCGVELPERSLPVVPRGERRPGDPSANKRLEALKTWRKGEAQRRNLDPGVLAPLSLLRAIARKGPRTMKDLHSIKELARWLAREAGGAAEADAERAA